MLVALFLQHTKRINPIILSSVVCLTIVYFETLSINDTVFGKKNTEHVFFLYFLYKLFKFFFCSKKNSARHEKNLYLGLHVKCMLLL